MARRGNKSKARKTHRKGTRRATRRMRGGYVDLNPSSVSNTSMNAPYKLNMLQGQEYGAQHANQHGGYQHMPVNTSTNNPVMNNPVMNNPLVNNSGMNNMNSLKVNNQMGGMAPVGDTGVLDAALRDSARIGPIDQAFQEIAGMKDQAGGRRRRRKSRKVRKARKSRKSRRSGHKSRRGMRGGALALMAAGTDANPMLLEGSSSSQAVAEMNPEWKLAENPNSFNPMK